jgi:hypothetical protein
MYALIIRPPAGYFILQIYPSLAEVAKTIKKYIQSEKLSDKPPTPEEIQTRIQNSLFDQYMHELEDETLITVMELNLNIEVLIEVKNGMIQGLKSNVPLKYYIKDLDEVEPSEWLIPWEPDEVSENIINKLRKEVFTNNTR